MKNILTFDVEDWFQVFYGENLVSKLSWDNYESEFPKMISKILMLLDKHENIKATFFIVGWLAKKYPNLLKIIHQNGHEIGSHSYYHSQVFNLSPIEFYKDTKMSKDIIEDVIGNKIFGYRAPGFSISTKMDWALDIVSSLDFYYDSSVLDFQGGVHKLDNGLIELSPNSIKFNSKYLPINGGFFFRLSPWFLYKFLIKNLNSTGIPLNFYTHSWEMMPGRLKLPIKGVKKYIQYHNIQAVEKKVDKMLESFQFIGVMDYLKITELKNENFSNYPR